METLLEAQEKEKTLVEEELDVLMRITLELEAELQEAVYSSEQ